MMMKIKVTLRIQTTQIPALLMRMTFVMVTTLRTASPVILMILQIPTLILILMMMKMVQKEIQEKVHQLRVSSQQLRRQLKIYLNNQSKPEKIIKIL